MSWELSRTGLPTSGDVRDVAFGDVNNDGKPDLVASFGAAPGLATYSGNGADVWSTASFTVDMPGTGSYHRLALSSIVVDDKRDILASRGTDAGLIRWRGDGLGAFPLTAERIPSASTLRRQLAHCPSSASFLHRPFLLAPLEVRHETT